MKAIVYKKYGPPEVLQMMEVEKPLPKDDEVLIKIYAASVNSWDWDLLRGKPYLYRLLFGVLKPKHKIIGCDIAGRVEAIGKNVKNLKPGDEVLGDISERWGGFAEYVCATEKTLTLKPAGMSFEDAAATPQAGVLAWQCLNDKRPVKKGDKVLINGAGGGVGTFALQLAKALGAEVTCVDAYNKLERLCNLGADHVMDYKKADFTKNGQFYDLIIDVVANRSLFDYKKSLTQDGQLVVVGGTIPTLLKVGILGGFLSKKEGQKLSILVHQANKDLAKLNELIQKGTIKPIIDSVFPLERVPKALQHLGEGKAFGKIVIKINN